MYSCFFLEKGLQNILVWEWYKFYAPKFPKTVEVELQQNWGNIFYRLCRTENDARGGSFQCSNSVPSHLSALKISIMIIIVYRN